jgi:hypothetical protein
MPTAVSEKWAWPPRPEPGFVVTAVQPVPTLPFGCSGNVVPGAPASARAEPPPRASAPATTAVPRLRRIESLMASPFSSPREPVSRWARAVSPGQADEKRMIVPDGTRNARGPGSGCSNSGPEPLALFYVVWLRLTIRLRRWTSRRRRRRISTSIAAPQLNNQCCNKRRERDQDERDGEPDEPPGQPLECAARTHEGVGQSTGQLSVCSRPCRVSVGGDLLD